MGPGGGALPGFQDGGTAQRPLEDLKWRGEPDAAGAEGMVLQGWRPPTPRLGPTDASSGLTRHWLEEISSAFDISSRHLFEISVPVYTFYKKVLNDSSRTVVKNSLIELIHCTSNQPTSRVREF